MRLPTALSDLLPIAAILAGPMSALLTMAIASYSLDHWWYFWSYFSSIYVIAVLIALKFARTGQVHDSKRPPTEKRLSELIEEMKSWGGEKKRENG